LTIDQLISEVYLIWNTVREKALIMSHDLTMARIVFKGIVGGALVGAVIGAYAVVLTEDHVVQPDGFARPLFFEQDQARYASTVLVAFIGVFTAIGPFIVAASFGPWIRHAVYGLVGSVGLVVVVALIAAAIMNQQPFNMNKVSHSTCIDIARIYAVPIAIIIGPAVGIQAGTLWRRQNLEG